VSDDTLANAERPEHDRPHAVAPAIPDLESNVAHWSGPASQWRARALRAELLVVELRKQLARYRMRP
jgi:hypothetical protein